MSILFSNLNYPSGKRVYEWNVRDVHYIDYEMINVVSNSRGQYNNNTINILIIIFLLLIITKYYLYTILYIILIINGIILSVVLLMLYKS